MKRRSKSNIEKRVYEIDKPEDVVDYNRDKAIRALYDGHSKEALARLDIAIKEAKRASLGIRGQLEREYKRISAGENPYKGIHLEENWPYLALAALSFVFGLTFFSGITGNVIGALNEVGSNFIGVFFTLLGVLGIALYFRKY